MARVIFLADSSERYMRRLLSGIAKYSQENGAWVITRIPPTIRDQFGIEEVLKWALKIKADAVIGQFYNSDHVNIFLENNILPVAIDFKRRFNNIPNITANHYLIGEMGAKYFVNKGFKNFAFYGHKDIVWSEERCNGFKDTIDKLLPDIFFDKYLSKNTDQLWYYDRENMSKWLKSLPKPIAIMASDDNQAYNITEMCKYIDELGYEIPYDIALLGVDNDKNICCLSEPNISSIVQNAEQGGYDAAQYIDTYIKNKNIKIANINVEATHIITRASSDYFANKNKHIATILKYIHSRITEKITVDDIVLQVPMSRRLLEITFKKETGLSIYDYIIKTRIDKMEELLRTDLPISQIAIDLGFFDTKNISRTFKKLKGYTPSEYRNMLQKK